MQVRFFPCRNLIAGTLPRAESAPRRRDSDELNGEPAGGDVPPDASEMKARADLLAEQLLAELTW